MNLLLQSKLPALEQFQDWVYETIKKIRQTGTYTIPQAVPLLEYTGTNPMNLQTENDLHYLVNTF
jgi:prophage antirepressor-like protein